MNWIFAIAAMAVVSIIASFAGNPPSFVESSILSAVAYLVASDLDRSKAA